MKEQKHEAPPRYDAAFKEGAIRLVTEESRPMREVAENFFSCLKCELVYLTSYATRRQRKIQFFGTLKAFIIQCALIPPLVGYPR